MPRTYNRAVQRKKRFLPLILLGAAWAIPGCGDRDSKKTTTLAGQNILLITLDTTRADHFGCYGDKSAKTPAIDAIASRGVLFEDAISQIPLTLPSHGAMMTGRYPRELGVRVNNEAAIGAAHPTLATLCKQKGYRTAAFIASFVLDSRFGLDRGFDVYDDEMSNVSIRVRPLDWERPGNLITDRALGWLEANKNAPFFCWVHYYDPHAPYGPPKPFPSTYAGEVAFMDTQVKRLDDWLDRSGQKEKTLLVIVGDHGESFNEHGEEGHGILLYQTSLHVPLLVAHPGLVPRPRRVAQPVGVVDVFPTIVELMGLPKPDGLLSRSFAGAWLSDPMPSREVYSESEYAWHAYGWAQQRSLINADWKFISSAKPELYDRKADRDEKNNVLDKRHDLGAEMSNRLFQRYSQMTPGTSQKLPPSAAAAAALSALGYTGGTARSADEFLSPGADDPKDRIDVLKKFELSQKNWGENQRDQAIELLRECVRQVPLSPAIRAALGAALVNTGKFEEALGVLDAAVKLDPTHQPALFSSGEAYFSLRQWDKALQFFTLAVENDPNDPKAQFMVGRVLVALRRPAEARPHFEKAVEILPEFPAAHFELAQIWVGLRDYDRAIQHFQETVRFEPGNDNAHYNLGSLKAATGKITEAIEAFQTTVKINPQHRQGWLSLGSALLQTGQTAQAKEALLRAAAFPETAAEANRQLAVIASGKSDN